MKISTKGRYARRQDIAVKYLEQIVPRLAGVGLLRSVRRPPRGLSRAPG